MVCAKQNNTLTRLQQKETCLEIQIAVIAPTEVDKLDKLKEQLSEFESRILQAQYDINAGAELPLTKEEKGEHLLRKDYKISHTTILNGIGSIKIRSRESHTRSLRKW